MNDENDKLIDRLNRLKPVEPVPQPAPDIEFMQKEEEIERQKDKFFDKREQFDQFKPVEQPPKLQQKTIKKITKNSHVK